MRQTTPSWLRALGRASFPSTVMIRDRRYALVHGFKHDFFAATALYSDGPERVVVKFGRRAHFFGLPMRWIGKLLACHEARMYRRLAGIDAVPRFMGMVGDDAIAHAYVEGRPLRKGDAVPDDFFANLQKALEAVHARDAAYVDLEKCENVLLGDDGKPYLIDFQISWYCPRRSGGRFGPLRRLLRLLQEADCYHLLKLQRRVRPDLMSEEDLAASYRRPLHLRLHRELAEPFQRVRRGVLARVDPRRGPGERGRMDTAS